VPAAEQAGPELYADNDFDRGHLVRRRDPVWGDSATATQANLDSFTYVNAAPQAALFNQGPTLWAGLEDYLLDHARIYRQRLSVYTAPVLADDDPTYRGVHVPRRYWKVAAWATDSDAGSQTLAATGYLLDQTDLLPPILQAEQRSLEPGQPPPLGVRTAPSRCRWSTSPPSPGSTSALSSRLICWGRPHRYRRRRCEPASNPSRPGGGHCGSSPTSSCNPHPESRNRNRELRPLRPAYLRGGWRQWLRKDTEFRVQPTPGVADGYRSTSSTSPTTSREHQ